MALEEKTEAPTDRRRQEARRKGQVARSIELTSALAVLATLISLRLTGAASLNRLCRLFRQCLTTWPDGDLNAGIISSLTFAAVSNAAAVLLPLLLVAVAAAAVVTTAQVGIMFSSEPLQPKFTRLDPIKGIARLFSGKGMVEVLRSVLKVSIVGYIMFVTIRDEAPRLIAIMNASWLEAVAAVASLAWTLVLRASLTILVIAIADYAFQRRQHEQDLKMTKQEVKEDMRRSEGDPTTRARIRAIMREMARRRMMSDVPKADVVITNPTHLAIAIRYDSDRSSAPVVVAKGQRLVAEKIVELARKSGVPIRQNIPVARALFKSVEVGQEVPVELYEAVAEILAAVYRMRSAASAGGYQWQ